MDLSNYIKQCVFKILEPDYNLVGRKSGHTIRGTGFWIGGEGYCITCYHVILDNRLDPNAVDIEYQGKLLKVSICEELSSLEKDIAILKITDTRIPPVSPAPLGLPQKNQDVWAFGFRKGYRKGYMLNGTLLGKEEFEHVGEVINFKTDMPDSTTVKGMSGSPIFDDEQNAVVGILYSQEPEGPAISYVNPMDKIFKCWPQLESKNASTLITKLIVLEKTTSETLEKEFIKLEIPYPEREADEYLRNELTKLSSSQFEFDGWVVVGEAGVGKSTLLYRLVEWCRNSEFFFPIWLDRTYFYEEGRKLNQLLDCLPTDWGSRLQDFAKLVQKQVVVFVDSLDVIISHTNDVKLVSQLNELAANSILICSSRPSEYERLQAAATPRIKIVELERLSDNQVIEIIEKAQDNYHIRLEELHHKLVEMCRNPFILYLLLESSKTEPLPQVSNPTDTWVRQKYWDRRVERVRPSAVIGNRFGSMQKEQVGLAKAGIAYCCGPN